MQVLDHGFIRLVEAWGTGLDCECEAARQSTQACFRGWADTPFEFAGMIVEIKAPIAVFREWHRHRIQSYAETNLDDTAFNEMFARYAPLPDINYVPTVERQLLVPGSASSTVKDAELFAGELDVLYKQRDCEGARTHADRSRSVLTDASHDASIRPRL